MKKALSLLLSLVLAFSSFPMAMAVTFTDEASWPASASWAREEIAYMTDKGILNGYAEDGTFRPADPVTRAQFIKMIVETFGLTATTNINYSDVKSGYWYYDYIAKAAAQGFLLNYGSALNPDGALTRQEAAALLARYLDLDPTERVPASTYTDYYSISSNYREYVLQASYVGLFQGDEDGKFSPERILKRCEAAAILYRAAGTIYRSSATGTEATAGDENAVISTSGVTITSAVIKGDLLITEGAAGGTVTLSGCTVDRVILRGTSSVVLSNCYVDEIVVDSSVSGYTTAVSLTGTGKVDAITAETAVDLDISSRSEVGVLTVDSTAKNSSVSGSGKLSSALINASGFTAASMPVKYTLAVGLTATLAGKTYSGTGVESGTTGFSKAPASYATTASCYLTATPNVTGQLYYYYTNDATAPTPQAFDSLYTAAAVKSYISSVTANTSIDQAIGVTANVSAYTYIALMIRGYEPVVIVNAASDGFAVDPIVTVGNTDESLNFTAATDGILYYYYTSSSTAPTTTTFVNNFNSNTYYYKGTMDAEANKAISAITLSAASVESYPYVVVSLRDASGNQYQPVVIEKGVSNQTGFTSAPQCQLSSGSLVLGFVPNFSGTVEYYYTTLSTAPTAAQFTTNKNAASANTSGSVKATANTAYFDALANQSVAAKYSYVAVRLTDEAGTVYQPVIVSIPAGSGVNLTGTGFSAVPKTSVTSGYIYLNVQTTAAGTLRYYLTNNVSAPSTTAFNMNFEANVTGSGLAARNGGITTLSIGNQTFTTGLSTEVLESFDFLVMMYTIGNTNMTPIVVTLPDVQGSANVQTSTGFLADPVYEKVSMMTHEISFTASVNGTVYYYYTDDPSVPDPNTVVNTVMTEMGNGNFYAGTASALKNYPNSFIVNVSSYVPNYVVLMIVDENGLYYTPKVIQADPEASSASAAGFKETPTVAVSGNYANLNYEPMIAGTLYYYFANTATAPTTSQFMNNWGALSATMGSMFSVTAASASKSIQVPTGYNYLVLMLVDTASGNYRTPVVLSLSGTTGTGTTTGYTGFSGTPYVYNGSLMFSATTTGTLNYYFSSGSGIDMSGLLGGMMGVTGGTNLFSGTIPVTYTGTQTATLVDSSMWAMISTYYTHVVLCMSTSNGSMLTPVTVALDGSTTGTGTGTGTTVTDPDGFSTNPEKQTSLGIVSFVPGTTDIVKYFFTLSDTTYTASTFSATYTNQVNSGAGGSMNVIDGKISNIQVTGYASYKYMWLQLGNNTPVRVQLY